ncbi:MAG: hypothetical protein JWO33_341 [Caulobacteraceae bacterium]|nr:hypothetical protein [Caulobacteraceae bacterium]
MVRKLSDVIIRNASEQDADAMAAYMAALSAEELDTVTRRPPPSVDDERAFVRKAQGAERAFILLAFCGGELVGLLDLWARGAPEFRHCGHFGMSVAKEWRGKGVGRRLLNVALRDALAWEGFCRLELEVTPWNTPAIRLYESLGFKVEARKAKAANFRGSPEEVILMARTW